MGDRSEGSNYNTILYYTNSETVFTLWYVYKNYWLPMIYVFKTLIYIVFKKIIEKFVISAVKLIAVRMQKTSKIMNFRNL